MPSPKKSRSPRLGKLPPRYGFILNPYKDARFSKCPRCRRLTYPRKFPLVIAVKGADPIVLGKTCKYCSKCELIVAHQDELESLLAQYFEHVDPKVIGNDYYVVATVDVPFWKRGKHDPPTYADTIEHMADIKSYYDVEYRPAGYYPDDAE